MATSGRAGRRGAATLGALLTLLSLNTAALANTVTPDTGPATDMLLRLPTFDDAMTAYNLKDFKRALELAEMVGSGGDSDAQMMAGHILLRGEADKIDLSGALKWFRKAADAGNTDAYMALGEMALRGHAGLSAKDALPWFSKAAQKRRADAMRAIGEMYIQGQGLTPDITKGRDWLVEAYEAGDALAARKIADSWFEQDAPKALYWYGKAADKGDYEAAYVAAIMLAENLDVKPDSERMNAFLKQAAEAGYAPAQADWGLIVYQGAGVKQSDSQAADWFRKASEGGDPEGMFLYAYTLAKGEGVKQSFEEAYYWLLRAGETDVKAYQRDRDELRERLEANVDPEILKRAKARAEQSARKQK